MDPPPVEPTLPPARAGADAYSDATGVTPPAMGGPHSTARARPAGGWKIEDLHRANPRLVLAHAGYERIIERTGGRKNWVRLMQQLKSADTSFLTRDSERGEALFKARGAEPDDVFVMIRPDSEVIAFQMRRIDGKWRIVFEMVCL